MSCYEGVMLVLCTPFQVKFVLYLLSLYTVSNTVKTVILWDILF